jgi:hypothetical protein
MEGKAANEKHAGSAASWHSELRAWLSSPLLVAVVAALLGSP